MNTPIDAIQIERSAAFVFEHQQLIQAMSPSRYLALNVPVGEEGRRPFSHWKFNSKFYFRNKTFEFFFRK